MSLLSIHEKSQGMTHSLAEDVNTLLINSKSRKTAGLFVGRYVHVGLKPWVDWAKSKTPKVVLFLK